MVPPALRDAVERVTVQIAELARELEGIIEASEGANLDDEHDPDGSTVGFERARVASLLAEASAQLVALEAALGRVSAGTYGTCATCGNAIGDERLVALPAVTTCVTCASTR
jgi:RNA polymerase-binding transcription factor DksA